MKKKTWYWHGDPDQKRNPKDGGWKTYPPKGEKKNGQATTTTIRGRC